MRARLGILLSGSGSTYENLHQWISDGRLKADIAVVIASRPGLGGCARAERLGHSLVIASQPQAVAQALAAHGATWVIMCGWLKYFDPPPAFAGRTLNVHPSLLPRFGGKGMYGHHVHAAVLESGERVSGCTVHLVSGGYDTGPILGQRQVPVLVGDTVETLAQRVQAAERELYPRLIAARLAAG